MGDIPKQSQGPKSGKKIREFLEAGGELRDDNENYGLVSSDSSEEEEEEEEEDIHKRTRSVGDIPKKSGKVIRDFLEAGGELKDDNENYGLISSDSSEDDEEEGDIQTKTSSAGDIPKKTGKVIRDFLEAGGELKDDNENYGLAYSDTSEEDEEEEDIKKKTRSAGDISTKMTIPKGVKQPSEKMIHDFLKAGGEVQEEKIDYGMAASEDESEDDSKINIIPSDNVSKDVTTQELAELGLKESDLQMSFNGEHVELKGDASGHRRDRSVTSRTSRTGKTTSSTNIDLFINRGHSKMKIIVAILFVFLLIIGGVMLALWQLKIFPTPVGEKEDLIDISPKNHQVMILMGGKKLDERKEDYLQTAEVFGSNRCGKFESSLYGKDAVADNVKPPLFKSEGGSTFLPAFNRIVSCGSYKRPGTDMYCISSNGTSWIDHGVADVVISTKAAHTHWFDKMVLIGGKFKYKRSGSSEIKEKYKQGVQVLDVSGAKIENIKPGTVGATDFIELIEEYGEESIEGACTITIQESENDVKIIITGGMNKGGKKFGKALQLEMKIESNEVGFKAKKELPFMKDERTSHGCVKTLFNEKTVLIVAGGLGQDSSGLTSVEYLELAAGNKWKSLGSLQNRRTHNPSIGRVLGHLVVLGGKANGLEITDIEVYNENNEKWEKKNELIHGEKKYSLKQGRYDHSTVMVSEDWCGK